MVNLSQLKNQISDFRSWLLCLLLTFCSFAKAVIKCTNVSEPIKCNYMQKDLFTDEPTAFAKVVLGAGLTCNTCQHRQRHQCNSKVIQYCGVRKSNRTENGLLKIKCKMVACAVYQPCL